MDWKEEEEKAQNEHDRRFAKCCRDFGDLSHFHEEPINAARASAESKTQVKPQVPVNDDAQPLPTVPEALAPGVGCMIPPRFDPESLKNARTVDFDMYDYCRSAVEQYKELSGISKLKFAPTPFLPEGSLVEADSAERGQMSGSACRVLMKDLWNARM